MSVTLTENNKDTDLQEPFKTIFAKSNKFEIFCRDLNNLGILETQQESIHKLLADLQKLLFDKPLKENAYQKIIQKISFLKDFVTGKKINTFKNETEFFSYSAKK